MKFRLYHRKSRKPDLRVRNPRTVFGDSLGDIKFNVLETNLLTSMQVNGKFSEALKRHYTLVYHDDRLSRNEYLCSKKRRWEIQASKCIIKEGLDWRFLYRTSRNDIFTTRF